MQNINNNNDETINYFLHCGEHCKNEQKNEKIVSELNKLR